MKYIFKIHLLLALLIFVTAACNKKQTESQNIRADNEQILSVKEFVTKAENFSNKTVLIEGIIEHLCRHSDKRFKIIDPDGECELKVESCDALDRPEQSDIGKIIIIKAKAIPVEMDIPALDKWENSIRKNHAGEENTEHFKEEIALVKQAKEKILNGETTHYTSYYAEAIGYEFSKK